MCLAFNLGEWQSPPKIDLLLMLGLWCWVELKDRIHSLQNLFRACDPGLWGYILFIKLDFQKPLCDFFLYFPGAGESGKSTIVKQMKWVCLLFMIGYLWIRLVWCRNLIISTQYSTATISSDLLQLYYTKPAKLYTLNIVAPQFSVEVLYKICKRIL